MTNEPKLVSQIRADIKEFREELNYSLKEFFLTVNGNQFGSINESIVLKLVQALIVRHSLSYNNVVRWSVYLVGPHSVVLLLPVPGERGDHLHAGFGAEVVLPVGDERAGPEAVRGHSLP